MMQDAPGHGHILTAEADADRLHDRVADGVGMAFPFSLNKFNPLQACRSMSSRFDNNVPCCIHKNHHSGL